MPDGSAPLGEHERGLDVDVEHLVEPDLGKLAQRRPPRGTGIVDQDVHLRFALGERVEIYPTNLDMTTSVYDRLFVTEGEAVVDAWTIMGRQGAPQR